ncbi:STAS/SEC14 domain-containing protein [Micrococcaceae bacterium Sec5.7]
MNANESGQSPDAALFDLELDPAGYLRLTWLRDASISEADAETAMAQVNLLCGEDRHPMVVDMATTADVSRGARAVFGRPCQASRIALLGASPVDRVIANFILGINKLPCPTKFFTSEREALSWLVSPK